MRARPTPTPPNQEQRALLDFLLSRPFPGRDSLQTQVPGVLVAPSCDCGCASFSIHVGGVACDLAHAVAVGAMARDHSEPFEVILFSCERGLHDVEIVSYDNEPMTRLPRPDELELLVDE